MRLVTVIRQRPPAFWLAVIACWFAFGQLVLLPLNYFISWDESIYSSQFAGVVPHIAPSPHRAIGMPLILGPVTSFTAELPVLRGYVAVLTSLGVFLAFRAWVPVNAKVAQIAAVLFATSALALTNGHMLMPNLLTGLGTVAAMAYFVRTVEQDGWRSRSGLIAALGFMSLMRPTDAVFLAGVLGVGVLLARRWRPRALSTIGTMVAGLAIGGIAWTIASVIQFGGPIRRLTATSDTADVGHDPLAVQAFEAVWTQLTKAPVGTVATGLAYLAAAVVVVLVVRGVCNGWPEPKWLLTFAAAFLIILPYYVLLAYASARYHLPMAGLLTVVAAAALHKLATRWEGNTRTAVIGVCVLAVLQYAGAQWQEATRMGGAIHESRLERARWAEVIAREGVQPPCRVAGHQAPAFAYTLRCHTGDNLVSLPNLTLWRNELQREWPKAQRSGATFVYIKSGFGEPKLVNGWRHIYLGQESGEPVYAYFPPGQGKEG
ncbi:MAG: hypothetical protein GEV07_19450 [Streptosporangiales bacterium]|nr:hypothetical protein [Streptosporangiales bacterium]